MENLTYWRCPSPIRRNEFFGAKSARLYMCLMDSVARFHDSTNLKRGLFLTQRDNLMINPIFEMLSSSAIRNIPDMPVYLW